jgi:hypothetical protein
MAQLQAILLGYSTIWIPGLPTMILEITYGFLYSCDSEFIRELTITNGMQIR